MNEERKREHFMRIFLLSKKHEFHVVQWTNSNPTNKLTSSRLFSLVARYTLYNVI